MSRVNVWLKGGVNVDELVKFNFPYLKTSRPEQPGPLLTYKTTETLFSIGLSTYWLFDTLVNKLLAAWAFYIKTTNFISILSTDGNVGG